MARTWVKVEGTVADHPKVAAFAALYGVEPDLTVGFFVRWWNHSIEYASNGKPARCSPNVLARFAEPFVKLSKLVVVPEVGAALFQAGLADKHGVPHDWQDYGGQLVAKRKAAKIRMRKLRATLRARSANVTPPEVVSSVPVKNRARARKTKTPLPEPDIQPRQAAPVNETPGAERQRTDDQGISAFREVLNSMKPGPQPDWGMEKVPAA